MAEFNPNVNNNEKKPYFLVERLHNEPDKDKYPNAKNFDEKYPEFTEDMKQTAIAKAEEIAKALADKNAFADKFINDKETGDPVKVKANRVVVDGHTFEGNDGKTKISFDVTIEGKKNDGLRLQGTIAANKDGELKAYVNNVKYAEHPTGIKDNSGKYTPAQWVEPDKNVLAKSNLAEAYEVVSGFVQSRERGAVTNDFPEIYTDLRDYINANVPQDYTVTDKETGEQRNVREIYVGAYKTDEKSGSFYVNTHSEESVKFTVSKDTGDYAIDIVSPGEDGKAKFTRVQDLKELDNVKGGKLIQDVVTGKFKEGKEEVPFEQDKEQEAPEK